MKRRPMFDSGPLDMAYVWFLEWLYLTTRIAGDESRSRAERLHWLYLLEYGQDVAV
jgi:hypothetical protein